MSSYAAWTISDLRSALAMAEGEVSRLKAALVEFGEHKETCDARRAWNAPEKPCDCGLDKAKGKS